MSDIFATTTDGQTVVIDSSFRDRAVAKGWTIHDDAAPAAAPVPAPAPAVPTVQAPAADLAGTQSSYASLTGLPQTPVAPAPQPQETEESSPPVVVHHPLYSEGGTRINFVRPEGDTYSIPNTPEMIAKATAKGWKPVSEAISRQAFEQEKRAPQTEQPTEGYPSLLSGAAAIASNNPVSNRIAEVGKGVSEGLVGVDLPSKIGEMAGPHFGAAGDYAAGGGAADAKATQQAFEESHPTESTIENIAGTGLGLVGGMMAMAPAAKATELAIRTALPAATTLAGRVGVAALAKGTAGAVFSAPQAMAQWIVDQDPKAAAQTLLWGMGLGAVFPSNLTKEARAALSASKAAAEHEAQEVLSGVAKAASTEEERAAQKEVEDLLSKRTPEQVAADAEVEKAQAAAKTAQDAADATKDAGDLASGKRTWLDWGREKLVKGAAAVSGKRAKDIEEFTRDILSKDPNAEGRVFRAAIENAPELQTKAANDSFEHLNSMLESLDEVTPEAMGEQKLKHTAEAMVGANPEKTAEAARDAALDVHETFEKMMADEDKFGSSKAIAKNLKGLNVRANALSQAVESGDMALQHNIVDSFKRDLQTAAKNEGAGIPNVRNGFERGQKLAFTRELENLAERLRVNLEGERWGAMGEKQANINSAWHNLLTAQGRFRSSMTDKYSGYATHRDYYRVTSQKADSFVRGLGEERNRTTHEDVSDFVKYAKALSSAIGKSYQLTPELQTQVARLHASADAFTKTVEQQKTLLVKLAQFQELKSDIARGRGGEKAGIFALAAHSVLGPIGTLLGGSIGQVLETMRNPAEFIERIAQIEKMELHPELGMRNKSLHYLMRRGRVTEGAEFLKSNAASPESASYQVIAAHKALADRLGGVRPALKAMAMTSILHHKSRQEEASP